LQELSLEHFSILVLISYQSPLIRSSCPCCNDSQQQCSFESICTPFDALLPVRTSSREISPSIKAAALHFDSIYPSSFIEDL